jgi:hypothetical protein
LWRVFPTTDAAWPAKCGLGSPARALGGGCGSSPRWVGIVSIIGVCEMAAKLLSRREAAGHDRLLMAGGGCSCRRNRRHFADVQDLALTDRFGPGSSESWPSSVGQFLPLARVSFSVLRCESPARIDQVPRICRSAHRTAAHTQDMRVRHVHGLISMSEQIPNGANVVSRMQQGVAKACLKVCGVAGLPTPAAWTATLIARCRRPASAVPC